MEIDGTLPPDIAAAVNRLDELIGQLEDEPDPTVHERAFAVLQCVDAVHRPGLRRLTELLRSTGLMRRVLDEPEVRLLFDLYELGIEDAAGEPAAPRDEQTRGLPVRARTDHDDGPGVRGPTPSSAPTVVTPSSGFVPLASLAVIRRPRLTWRDALRFEELPLGEARGLQIADDWVLVANPGGKLVAYRNACPGTPLPLHGGEIVDAALRCPWHGCRFDLRDGARLDAHGPGLPAVPIKVDGGVVRVGVWERATT